MHFRIFGRRIPAPLAMCVVTVFFLFPPLVPAPMQAQAGAAQPASANADLVKMIQAGLPESVVVNKIKERAGQWDTSVDALIALKQAGATEAELAALTAAPASPAGIAATANPSPGQPPAAVPVLGGTVTNNHGVVSVFMPDLDGDFKRRDLLFQVVIFNGAPALRMDAEADKWGATIFQCTATFGDLVIEKDKTTFFPFARAEKKCVPGPWVLSENLTPVSWNTTQIDPRHGPGLFGVAFEKGGPRFYFGNAYAKKNRPTPSEAFLNLCFKDFSGTMATILKAAGVDNPSAQLASSAQYHPPTKETAAALVEQHNKMDSINRAQQQAEAQRHPQQSGNGVLAAMNVAQGFATMAQATKAGTTAGITGNAAGQMAAMQQEMAGQQQMINGLSGNNNAPAQTPGGATAISAAATAGGSVGGGSYNGPNADWVRKMLSYAGAYSCSPSQPPARPSQSQIVCTSNDGYFYQAVQIAWAVECEEETGHHNDAVNLSNTLMQTLKNSSIGCDSSMVQGCTTTKILSCSERPR